MLNCSQVSRLCREHTSLSEREIEKIEQVSRQLQLIADLTGANVFIDCPMREPTNAIVVAEASPSSGETLYYEPYVGTVVYEQFEPSVFLSLRAGKSVLFNKAVTQRGIFVKQSVTPIKNDKDQVIGTLIKEEHDPREIQKMKSLSPATEMLWELFFSTDQERPALSDIMKEHFILIDSSMEIVYANPSAKTFIAEVYNLGPCEGKPAEEVMPFIKPVIHSRKDLVIEEIQVSRFFLEVKKVDIYKQDQVTGMLILIRDVTDLRMKERELVVKSVVIREIHHRVKNNLQAVASLLRLQIRKGVSEESRGYLTDSLNRVLSIASVYEIILANDNIDDDEVDIVSLSNKIAQMIIQNSHSEQLDLQFSCRGEPILADSKKAVSIALVVNELVQNSIKHAFHNRPAGAVDVTFKREKSKVTLTVADNGTGMKKEAKRSLGLDIVKNLIEHDLSGEYYIGSSSQGTTVIVSFTLEQEGVKEYGSTDSAGRR
ncbi:sensor histidine kinase [Bacillus badius]|uniref:histidine kinase n=1 Tax=Bacillus badius TaxID=1455 RepID=A0ABR5AV34_BACBA|nr:histidine kinase N-terminal domain-containing protein [Bacillus badius]KIL78580.1 Ethanolamine sensory transduction histidine kinase [Bacillus badius]MED4715999.1 histidine kinase N-terminal domain-containing protein [Bacillus badius]